MENGPHRVRDNIKKRPYSGFYLSGIAIVIVAILSFYGGISYQKQHQTNTSNTSGTSSTAGSGFGGRRLGGGNRTIGQVSAISSSSISITSQTDGSTKTFAISSSTQISDSGQSVTTSDIKVGDTVFVSASSTAASQALRILVNPSFGGGAPQPTTPPSTSTN